VQVRGATVLQAGDELLVLADEEVNLEASFSSTV
jgi:hypothetical protein